MVAAGGMVDVRLADLPDLRCTCIDSAAPAGTSRRKGELRTFAALDLNGPFAEFPSGLRLAQLDAATPSYRDIDR